MRIKMKKVYLLLAGALSFTQLVEAQNYICEPGQILCSDEETCYDPKTQCCDFSIVTNRIGSVTVKIKNSTKDAPILNPKCSQFYFAQEGDWIPYSYESANGGPPETGGPWTVSLKSEKHSGLCPGSTVVVEAVKSGCFSEGWQLGYNNNLQEPKSKKHKNPILYIEAPAIEKENSAPTPEPQAPTN
jgi:hypothetical protein